MSSIFGLTTTDNIGKYNIIIYQVAAVFPQYYEHELNFQSR